MKIDTQHYRDDLDKLRGRFADLYQKRAPMLKNYEKFSNETIHSLLGESMPQMQSMFAQAKGIGAGADRFLASAEGYDTPERRMEASGRAMSDVETAGETARQGAIARLESYGIDPSQTRGAALDQNLRVQSALEAVKAGRDAELGVEGRGRDYTAQALGLQQDAARTSAGLSATGAQIGQAGANAQMQNAQQWANIYGTPMQNMQAREGLINSGATMKFNEVQSRLAMKGAKSNTAGQIGSMVGMVGGAALGSFGGPMGTMMGAQMGSQLGSMAGGGGGSATGMSGGGASYANLPTTWDSSGGAGNGAYQ